MVISTSTSEFTSEKTLIFVTFRVARNLFDFSANCELITKFITEMKARKMVITKCFSARTARVK
jgi:hypothetical protein